MKRKYRIKRHKLEVPSYESGISRLKTPESELTRTPQLATRNTI
ncbi:MAG: hypothetical protein PHP31_05725 [Lentimicrobiaceae bacterium]|nr:hypothetical protein [Lentimicrobiaceae bacterium]